MIVNCLLKWFAPILTFTSEEIFKIINKDGASIHLEKFPNIPKSWKNEKLELRWKELIKVRDKCNISIEEKRAEKIVGSSLETQIELKLNSKLFKSFKDFNFEEFLISSKVNLIEDNKLKDETAIIVSKAKGNKCPICWKFSENSCERHGCAIPS